ncbi:hypothetical protein Taro_034837, partial [Colocasia esculenta]|nr:hypothetical protein [Colocasia esculenta]
MVGLVLLLLEQRRLSQVRLDKYSSRLVRSQIRGFGGGFVVPGG